MVRYNIRRHLHQIDFKSGNHKESKTEWILTIKIRLNNIILSRDVGCTNITFAPTILEKNIDFMENTQDCYISATVLPKLLTNAQSF